MYIGPISMVHIVTRHSLILYLHEMNDFPTFCAIITCLLACQNHIGDDNNAIDCCRSDCSTVWRFQNFIPIIHKEKWKYWQLHSKQYWITTATTVNENTKSSFYVQCWEIPSKRKTNGLIRWSAINSSGSDLSCVTLAINLQKWLCYLRWNVDWMLYT